MSHEGVVHQSGGIGGEVGVFLNRCFLYLFFQLFLSPALCQARRLAGSLGLCRAHLVVASTIHLNFTMVPSISRLDTTASLPYPLTDHLPQWLFPGGGFFIFLWLLFIYFIFPPPLCLVYCLGVCGFFWEKLRLGSLPLSSRNDGHAPGPS
ncbi:uncharacterized protein B0T23DRAFT_386580 [Neurospora hispaniola]|uniref:Uncharacterized protein n=1 Tax=Neurospora hispaniola TaxID=588809 RepID=A0AAJ0I266_9PEZI|nr:hypothetical protein B0T23DRAFT_386580 [Neurospora hispaniola]